MLITALTKIITISVFTNFMTTQQIYHQLINSFICIINYFLFVFF